MFVKHALVILPKLTVSSFMASQSNDLKYDPNRGTSVQRYKGSDNGEQFWHFKRQTFSLCHHHHHHHPHHHHHHHHHHRTDSKVVSIGIARCKVTGSPVSYILGGDPSDNQPVAELRNVTDMTDISVWKYWQVGVKVDILGRDPSDNKLVEELRSVTDMTDISV